MDQPFSNVMVFRSAALLGRRGLRGGFVTFRAVVGLAFAAVAASAGESLSELSVEFSLSASVASS